MIIANYKNGNYKVKLYSDGTKVRMSEETPIPIHPESIDLKITNYCEESCPYCHESSNLGGCHADSRVIFKALKGLPPGVEIAIGGGNPLAHPFITAVLMTLKNIGLIANITVNSLTLGNEIYRNLLDKLIKSKLVHGVGVSLSNVGIRLVVPSIDCNNIVYHLIAGIDTDIAIDHIIYENPKAKILILGYKQIGRGSNFYSDKIKANIEKLATKMSEYLTKVSLSFDNLALEQLNIKSHFDQAAWTKNYMGDEGQFTMFYDAVENKYAISSCDERMPLQGTIVEAFKDINNKVERREKWMEIKKTRETKC